MLARARLVLPSAPGKWTTSMAARPSGSAPARFSPPFSQERHGRCQPSPPGYWSECRSLRRLSSLSSSPHPNPTRQPVPLPTLHGRSLLAIIIRLWPCNGAPGIIYLTPSLPHDISREDFYANQEPAAE